MKGLSVILSFVILAMSVCFLECDALLMTEKDMDEMAQELEVTSCWDDLKVKLFDGKFSILKVVTVPRKLKDNMNQIIEGPCGEVAKSIFSMDKERLQKLKGKVMGMLKKRGMDLTKLLEMAKNLNLESLLG